MTETRKISSVLKSFMPVASQPKEIVRAGEQVDSPPPMPVMGDRLNGAVEIANRKREQQNKAQHRVRTVESKIYSAIGRVIGDAAELKKVSPIELLGLAEYVAEVLEQPEVQLEIRQRGIAIYEAKYARAKTLCMLGVTTNKDLAEALRAAGFVRVSQQWAGPANIIQAISIALEHELTLLRHEGHETIHYIKKGVRQPALAELEAEHADMVAQVTAVLAAPAGEEAAGEPAMPESSDAAPPSADRKGVLSVERSDPESGGPETRLDDAGSEAVAFAGRPRLGFNKGTTVRSASTPANTNKDA